MTRRRILRGVVGAVALVLLAGAAGFWWVFLRDDTPSAAALPEREVAAAPSGELDGRWVVQPGRDVWAGYRIDEHLSALDNTAVARTRDVEGELTVVGTEVTDVSVSVAMDTLTSEDDQVPGVGNRDAAMRTKGLETDTFPTATFTLTEPIELGALPEPGATLTLDAAGMVELHGVTRQVTVPLEARWNGEVIDLTASLEVALADYGIEQPAARIVTVADTGTMELQLTFAPTG
jgi:polyisoprenoid-binding protein YceI